MHFIHTHRPTFINPETTAPRGEGEVQGYIMSCTTSPAAEALKSITNGFKRGVEAFKLSSSK